MQLPQVAPPPTPPPVPDPVAAVAEAAKEGVETLVETVTDAGEDLAAEGRRAADEVAAAGRDAARSVEDVTRRSADSVADEIRRARSRLERDARRAARRVQDQTQRAMASLSLAFPALEVPQPPELYQERSLTQEERDLAESVFERTLPYGAIAISNGLGFFARPYTVPVPRIGSYVVHMGTAGFAGAASDENAPTFIHELTHVWQGEHWKDRAHYVVDSVYNQLRYGAAAYTVPEITPDTRWDSLTAEQQAEVVEDWFVGGRSEADPRFRFIRDNIRAGTD